MHSPREAAETSAMAGAEAAEPGHHGHRPHRRYFRSATQSKKDFAANQGMEWVKRCDKGSLEPVWRAVVARPAAAAGGRCSAELLRGPSKGPILRSQGRRSPRPPPGVAVGSPAAPAVQASDWRLRIGRYRCVAWHRIALREARALPPSHIISHSLSAVALCRRWQRWSIDNIDLKVSARQYHFNADRGCL